MVAFPEVQEKFHDDIRWHHDATCNIGENISLCRSSIGERSPTLDDRSKRQRRTLWRPQYSRWCAAVPTWLSQFHITLQGRCGFNENNSIETLLLVGTCKENKFPSTGPGKKNGSQVARIFRASPGISGKQQQEQNSRNLGTIFLPGPVHLQKKNIDSWLNRWHYHRRTTHPVEMLIIQPNYLSCSKRDEIRY